jgi:hypothetical protein
MILVTFSAPLHASTSGFDTLVNYDTAWTYVYDGGTLKNGKAINDYFFDLKTLLNGTIMCVGQSADSSNTKGILVVKFDPSGKFKWKKRFSVGGGGYSIAMAKNGDFIIGGSAGSSPEVMRIDSLGNVKWQTWLFDTVTYQPQPLSRSATINSLCESSRGTIICAAGDPFPNNGGTALSNYAAYLEFDSLGKLINYSEWKSVTGIAIAGFSIAETKGKNMLLGGNQAVFYLDSVGNAQWQTKYTFQLNL